MGNATFPSDLSYFAWKPLMAQSSISEPPLSLATLSMFWPKVGWLSRGRKGHYWFYMTASASTKRSGYRLPFLYSQDAHCSDVVPKVKHNTNN